MPTRISEFRLAVYFINSDSKYLLVTLRKLLVIYSCYVLYGLFLSFAPRKE